MAACVGPAWAGAPKVGPVPPAGTVRVEGVVSYDGPLPEPIPVHEAGTVRHLVEVEPKAKGLKEAVVWLEGVPRPARSGDEAPEEPVVMDQQNYFFVPHVLAVEAGRAVEFRNGDVANHGVTASSPEPENRFNVVTPPGGGPRTASWPRSPRWRSAARSMRRWPPGSTSSTTPTTPSRASGASSGSRRCRRGGTRCTCGTPTAACGGKRRSWSGRGSPSRLRIEFHGDDRERRGRTSPHIPTLSRTTPSAGGRITLGDGPPPSALVSPPPA